jgi:hypothetical protein
VPLATRAASEDERSKRQEEVNQLIPLWVQVVIGTMHTALGNALDQLQVQVAFNHPSFVQV